MLNIRESKMNAKSQIRPQTVKSSLLIVFYVLLYRKVIHLTLLFPWFPAAGAPQRPLLRRDSRKIDCKRKPFLYFQQLVMASFQKSAQLVSWRTCIQVILADFKFSP